MKTLKNTDIKDFKDLLQTSNETQRVKWVKNYLKGYDIKQDKMGNLSAIKTPLKFTPTLNAHLDTVHDDIKSFKKQVFFDSEKQVFWSPQGIGGDDLCGIFLVCFIFKHYNGSLQVIFNVLEEFGGIGSSNFQFTNKPSYIITIDRKGIKDLVTEISGVELMEKDLKKQVVSIAKRNKRNLVTGMFADCLNYSKDGYATMNISCGYYSPHTLQEYISFVDMKKTELLILDLLKSIPIKKYISGKSKDKKEYYYHYSNNKVKGCTCKEGEYCQDCYNKGYYNKGYCYPYSKVGKNPCAFCESDKAHYDNYYEAYFCDDCLLKFTKEE